jgi:hypothetical protein
MNNWLSRIPQKCWAYTALAIWAALCFMLLHKTSYGIDEGAAQALLLVWSIADNVVSPIVTLGFPDFRAVFLAPVGFLWTGDVLPAKVATILVMAISAWSLHTWRLHKGEPESALLATGLLMISPLLLVQIDTISVASFMLFSFALGAWADQIYRESQKAFGGMYFSQLFLCFVTITLHPIGFAYPLALLWAWYKEPVDKKHQTYFFGGIGAAVLMALVLTLGWSHITWFLNPLKSLASVLLGPATDDEFGFFHWVAGITMAVILLLVIWKQARNLWADLLGRTLLTGLAIGIFVGDEIFGIVALTTCLYWGLPLLLNKSTHLQGGFWKQRGFILVLTVFLATTCMISSKLRYQTLQTADLSPRDSLIKVLAEDSGLFLNEEQTQDSAAKKSFRVASQWPALTMLACRCDALPLPPDAKDSDALFEMLHGIDYLIFDPKDINNSSLSHNLANMGAGKTETIVLQPGGVIVQVKSSPPISAPDTKQKI